MSEWILMEEREPEEDQEVIVRDRLGNVWVEQWVGGHREDCAVEWMPVPDSRYFARQARGVETSSPQEITLRDFFAGCALAGLAGLAGLVSADDDQYDYGCGMAYHVADVMLRVRKEGNQ